ncbi:hypothetical protein, conserved, partial [Eimeria acervulina]
CPDFIPFASPLFQLRLHHFIFSYFAALATFCQITRTPQNDTPLDLAQYGNWQPMIHPHEPIDKDRLSLLLQTLQFHTLSLERSQATQRDPVNFLRIPQTLFQFDLRVLPNVNDLFIFNLMSKADKSAGEEKAPHHRIRKAAKTAGSRRLLLPPKEGLKKPAEN